MFDFHLSQYVALCYKVAPEMFGTNFYMVRWPESMPSPFQIGAFATHGNETTLCVRDALVAANVCRGPGPTIVWCDPPSEGVTIHELAHLLPIADCPPDFEPTQAARDFELRAMNFWASGDEPPIDPGKPWREHEADWIRRVFHLWWRAVNRHGYHIHPSELHVAGERYGLSHGQRYLRALGDEPARLAELTFNEIETIDPPQEFTDLFSADCERWNQNRKDLETCKQ
jgi:hypothetical protein